MFWLFDVTLDLTDVIEFGTSGSEFQGLIRNSQVKKNWILSAQLELEEGPNIQNLAKNLVYRFSY